MVGTRIVNVVVAAKSGDLTDLATVRDELSYEPADTGDNLFLARGISQVSSAVANYCRRVFPIETVSETLSFDSCGIRDRNDAHSIRLSRWPIVKILAVAENSVALVEGVDYRADYASGLIYRTSSCGSVIPWPIRSMTITYAAGYAAMPMQTAQIPTTPFQITVTDAAKFEIDRGVTFATGAALVAVASSPAPGQYTVVNGLYTFNAADAGSVVFIGYAYTAIPADIVMAVLRTITARVRARGRDPMQTSSSQGDLGNKQFWVGGTPGQDSAFLPEIASILDNYRVPRFS